MPRRLKALKPGRPESVVLSQCLDVLGWFGIPAIHRNTGGFVNPRGQYVACGEPGDPDISEHIPAGWGNASGKRLAIEVKREGFRPEKARGAERERFKAQLAKLRQVNHDGGFGFWVDDAVWLIPVLNFIKDGYRIDIDERGYCHVVMEDIDG